MRSLIIASLLVLAGCSGGDWENEIAGIKNAAAEREKQHTASIAALEKSLRIASVDSQVRIASLEKQVRNLEDQVSVNTSTISNQGDAQTATANAVARQSKSIRERVGSVEQNASDNRMSILQILKSL